MAGVAFLAAAALLVIGWRLIHRSPFTVEVDFVPGMALIQGIGGVKQYAGSFLLFGAIVQVPAVISAVMMTVHVTWTPPSLAMGHPEVVHWPDEALFAGVIWALVAVYLLQGALAYGCLRPLRGNRPSFLAILRHGFPGLLRMFPLAVVVFLLVALPVFLAYLVDPWSPYLLIGIGLALVIHSAVALAIPVAYSERLGVFRALRRSVELTNGVRWRIAVIALGVALLFGALLSMGWYVFEAAFLPMHQPHALLILTAIVGALTAPIHATTLWIVYETVCRARGDAETPIERIFA